MKAFKAILVKIAFSRNVQLNLFVKSSDLLFNPWRAMLEIINIFSIKFQQLLLRSLQKIKLYNVLVDHFISALSCLYKVIKSGLSIVLPLQLTITA